MATNEAKLEYFAIEGEGEPIPVELVLNEEIIQGSEIEGNVSQPLVPGKSRTAEAVCLEPGCDFRCKRIPGLRSHLQEIHNFSHEMKVFEFKSEAEFKVWMSKIESEHLCSYMRRRGWQTNKNGTRTCCYYCNRGGAYASCASKKQPKSQGSCKTGIECTSSLKVSQWSSSKHEEIIRVEAYLQHYGHNFELGHTRIQLHDRKEIEEKLRNGVSRHKILDEIRGSLDRTSGLSRRHLISLQDIYNIEKRSGITASRGRYSSEAGITAQAWIEGMQQSEDNPVLLIKYQQEAATEACKSLTDDDFILVVQTPLQAKMLQKYGPRQFMCIDVTQGGINNVDRHGFLLFALEVLIPTENDSKDPYPVAWCVSNRKDEEIIRILFNCVKENLHGFTLTPAFFFVPPSGVTTGGDWFDIWTKTFGAGPRKLISSWHVIEEWRVKLQSKSPAVYTSTSERSRVTGNLETVIRETTAGHFMTLLMDCIADLKMNTLTSSFGEYFEASYASHTELWASAYRTEAVNEADACLDAFHSRLSKHIYHEALKRKQLDILVKTLMKYTRDNVLTKLRNLHKGKSEFHLHSVTAQTHKDSLQLPLEYVVPTEGKSNEWGVMSVVKTLESDGPCIKQLALQHHVVVETEHRCTARLKCLLRCNDCAACPHQIKCTCVKNAKQGEVAALSQLVMCVHAHQVCRYLSERRNLYVDDFLQAPSLMTSQSSLLKSQSIMTSQVGHPKEEREILDGGTYQVVDNQIVTVMPQSDVVTTTSNDITYMETSSDTNSEDIGIYDLTKDDKAPTMEQNKEHCDKNNKRSIEGSKNITPVTTINTEMKKFQENPKIIFIPTSANPRIIKQK